MDGDKHQYATARQSQLLQYFFDDADVCFALLDRVFNFLEVNQALASFLGLAPETCRGRNYFDFFSQEHQPLFDQARDKGEEIRMHSEPLMMEVADSGSMTYWNWSLKPIADEFGETQMLAISRFDVTEQTTTKLALQVREQELLNHRNHLEEQVLQRTLQLAESEQRFRALADSAPALIWMTDVDNQWEWFNRSMLRFTGLTMVQALLDGWEFLIHEHEAEEFRRTFSRAITSGKKFKTDFRIKRPNGTYSWMTSIGTPRFSSERRYEGFIGYCWDISEAKMTEFEMAAAREEAEKANYAKSEFLSRMSHELRTPLNAVLGFSQLLSAESAGMTAAQVDNIEEITRAGSHLLDLIGDVLDLSSIEAGRLKISMGEVDLETTLLECLSLVAPMADKHKVHISFNETNLSGVSAYGDTTRLKQVLLNLLSNAVKYNRPLGSVSVFARVMDNHRIRISVQDTGIGISKENLPSLFLPFNRLGAEMTEIEGTGIGLVIVRRLIELMGGSVGVESTQGAGSTFWIELACFPVLDAAAHPELSNCSTLPDLQVLYVDDNRANIQLLERVLAQYAHVNILTVKSLEQAAALVDEGIPDILVVGALLLAQPDSPLESALSVLEDKSAPAVVVVGDKTEVPVALEPTWPVTQYLRNPYQFADILPLIDELVENAT